MLKETEANEARAVWLEHDRRMKASTSSAVQLLPMPCGDADPAGVLARLRLGSGEKVHAAWRRRGGWVARTPPPIEGAVKTARCGALLARAACSAEQGAQQVGALEEMPRSARS